MLRPISLSSLSKTWACSACSAALSLALMACQPTQTAADSALVWTPAAAPNVFDSRVERLQFPNGTRAILAQSPSIPGREDRVFVGVYVEYGTSSESITELAHLSEHLAANSRVTLRNFEIDPDIETFNGNAMTRLDYSSIWRVTKPEDLTQFLPERANHLEGVVRTEAVFDTEITRVKAEHERNIANNERRGIDPVQLIKLSYWGAGHPTSEDRIAGLDSIDWTDAYDEVAAYYRPDNGLLIVAGNFDFDKTAADLQTYLPIFTPRPGPDPKIGEALQPYQGMITRVDPNSQVTKVSIGFDLPDRDSDDVLAFLILDQLLTGGRQQTGELRSLARAKTAPLSTVMFDKLEARGIGDDRWYPVAPPYLAARSPFYVTQSYEAEGYHDPSVIEQTLTTEFANIVANDLTDEAIHQAKTELLEYLNHWMQGQDYLALADHLAAFEFIDEDPTRLNRLDDEIINIDADRVRAVAQSYTDDRPIRIAVVLPEGDAEETE